MFVRAMTLPACDVGGSRHDTAQTIMGGDCTWSRTDAVLAWQDSSDDIAMHMGLVPVLVDA